MCLYIKRWHCGTCSKRNSNQCQGVFICHYSDTLLFCEGTYYQKSLIRLSKSLYSDHASHPYSDYGWEHKNLEDLDLCPSPQILAISNARVERAHNIIGQANRLKTS